MGFYGTIVDRANEVFKFEKIYNNRYEMDAAAAAGTDHIFPGHFVLVKYDQKGQILSNDIYTVYMNNDGICYADAAFTQPLKFVTFTQVPVPRAANWAQYWEKYNDIIYLKLPNQNYFNANQTNYYTASVQGDNVAWEGRLVRIRSSSGQPIEVYYKCIGQNASGNATWQLIDDNSQNQYEDYFQNYAIDRSSYSLQYNSFGYDSTVWEKVYRGGVGEFILVARLNGMVPDIKLYADAPSIYPSAPHLDSKTTDALYRVHVPSRWGFQFKEEEPVEDGGLSDGQQFYKIQYDASTDSFTQGALKYADIYLNKRGMLQKEQRYYDSNTTNEILLAPCEENNGSGKAYFDSEGNLITQDIMELSIHVPALGNAVSDAYDVIYGYDNAVTESPQPRYTDINWISGSQSDEIKYNGPQNKKTHDLNTIAGSLNTIHDRLGQIIVPLDRWLNPADNNYDAWIASLNGKKCIYSYQSSPNQLPSYYRLSEEERYQDPVSGTFSYVPIDFSNNESAYSSNTFYYLTYKFNSNVNTVLYESNASHASAIADLRIDMSGSYTPRPDRYYYKKSIAEITYTPIELESYEPDKYFLKNDTSYIRDHGVNGAGAATNAPTNPYAQYYTIDETNFGEPNANVEEKTFTNGYTARSDFYYQQPGSNNFLWAIEDYPVGSTTYYTTVVDQVFEQQQGLIYKKNLFYYSLGTGGELQYFAMTEDTYSEFRSRHAAAVNDSTFRRYWLEFDEENPVVTIAEIDGVPQTVLSYPVKTAHEITNNIPIFDFPTTSILNQNYEQFMENHPGMQAPYRTLYFKDENNNYISYENLENIYPMTNGIPYYAVPRAYYMLALAEQQLYIRGRYYVRNPSGSTGNYEISWNAWNRNTHYYTIREIIPVTKPFYEPNKYYFKDSQNANYSNTPDQTAAYNGQAHHAYYAIKQKLYVESDSSGRCPVGYEWNDESIYIPASVVLKQIVKRLVLVEMEGMDNGMSSINGSLLSLAQTYCPESKTRDITTFRGGLNKLQDLLYTIDRLTPGKVVYVNDFGQLTTGDLSYEQLIALTS